MGSTTEKGREARIQQVKLNTLFLLQSSWLLTTRAMPRRTSEIVFMKIRLFSHKKPDLQRESLRRWGITHVMCIHSSKTSLFLNRLTQKGIFNNPNVHYVIYRYKVPEYERLYDP